MSRHAEKDLVERAVAQAKTARRIGLISRKNVEVALLGGFLDLRACNRISGTVENEALDVHSLRNDHSGRAAFQLGERNSGQDFRVNVGALRRLKFVHGTIRPQQIQFQSAHVGRKMLQFEPAPGIRHNRTCFHWENIFRVIFLVNHRPSYEMAPAIGHHAYTFAFEVKTKGAEAQAGQRHSRIVHSDAG